jgi:hypothetical protein
MSDKPFDAKACDMGGQASATNGLSDIKTHIENAPCNRPLRTVSTCVLSCDSIFDLVPALARQRICQAILLRWRANACTESQVELQVKTQVDMAH